MGLLKKIANEVGPEDVRSGHAWRAYERGLMPLLEDNLLDDTASGAARASWDVINEMVGSIPENASALLNSHFSY